MCLNYIFITYLILTTKDVILPMQFFSKHASEYLRLISTKVQ